MKKRMLSLALCLVLVVGLFSGLTVNASAGIFEDFEAKKKEIAEKIIKEKIKQLKEEFEIPDLDTDAIISSFTTAAHSTPAPASRTPLCPPPSRPCPASALPTARSC